MAAAAKASIAPHRSIAPSQPPMSGSGVAGASKSGTLAVWWEACTGPATACEDAVVALIAVGTSAPDASR